MSKVPTLRELKWKSVMRELLEIPYPKPTYDFPKLSLDWARLALKGVTPASITAGANKIRESRDKFQELMRELKFKCAMMELKRGKGVPRAICWYDWIWDNRKQCWEICEHYPN